MARMVATKAALSIRVDALTDVDEKSEPQAPSIGIENRAKLEARLHALEQQGDGSAVRSAFAGKKQARFQMTGETKTYNTAADAVDLVPTQREPMEAAVQAVLDVKAEKKRAKEERRAKKRAEKGASSDVEMDVDGEEDKKEDKKKRKRRESEANGDAEKVCRAALRVLRADLTDRYRSPQGRPRRSARHEKRHGRRRRRPLRARARTRRSTTARRRRKRESQRHSRVYAYLLTPLSSCLLCPVDFAAYSTVLSHISCIVPRNAKLHVVFWAALRC